MLSEKDQPRQAFLFHRAYPALGKRIQVRTACRQPQGLDLAGLDHLAKHRTELAVAIVQQVATVCQKAPILHRYVSRLLLHPLLVRIRRDPGQAHAPRLQLDEEKHYVTKPLRVKTSTVNKSVPATTSMWARMKSRQRVVCLRCGAGAMPLRLRTLLTVWSETLCPRLASAPPCDRSPTTDSLAPCARSDPRSSSQPAAAQPIAGRPIHQTCAPPAYETSAEWYRALPPPPLRPMPCVPAGGRFRPRYASPRPIVVAGL